MSDVRKEMSRKVEYLLDQKNKTQADCDSTIKQMQEQHNLAIKQMETECEDLKNSVKTQEESLATLQAIKEKLEKQNYELVLKENDFNDQILKLQKQNRIKTRKWKKATNTLEESEKKWTEEIQGLKEKHSLHMTSIAERVLGLSPTLVDYLADEILREQPPEEKKSFLKRIGNRIGNSAQNLFKRRSNRVSPMTSEMEEEKSPQIAFSEYCGKRCKYIVDSINELNYNAEKDNPSGAEASTSGFNCESP